MCMRDGKVTCEVCLLWEDKGTVLLQTTCYGNGIFETVDQKIIGQEVEKSLWKLRGLRVNLTHVHKIAGDVREFKGVGFQ